MDFLKKILLLAVISAMVSSCAYRKLAYFQDMDTVTTYDATEGPESQIHKNDKVKILVGCTNPALAAPFNLGAVEATVDPVTGQMTMPQSGSSAVEYLVDKNGDILFPVLGTLHVDGLTLAGVRELITSQIIAKDYIKDPIVTVEFSNFQITVLGEVSAKGNYLVNGNVTILEAIALCGDLTTSAIRNDVWVIRTEGKKRNVYSLDLTSKSCYDSPAFFLQQNDVVYVKPRNSKMGANGQLAFLVSTAALSAVASIASVVAMVIMGSRK